MCCVITATGCHGAVQLTRLAMGWSRALAWRSRRLTLALAAAALCAIALSEVLRSVTPAGAAPVPALCERACGALPAAAARLRLGSGGNRHAPACAKTSARAAVLLLIMIGCLAK